MLESKYSSAASASFWLRAEARLARLANGVFSAASAKPVMAKTPAAAAASDADRLSAVVRIDMDIVLRQIAGPERSRSFPFAGDPEYDRDVRIVQAQFHIAFIERSGQPIAADLHVLQRDI